MTVRVRAAFFAVLLATAWAAAAFAVPQTGGGVVFPAVGGPGLKAIYPEPGEETGNGKPIIAADLSLTLQPVDPATVIITINDVDVTGDAEVTKDYVLYTPGRALPAGEYEVRVRAADVKGAKLEPAVWRFSVKPPPEGAAGARPEPIGGRRDNTIGSMTVSSDYVDAKFTQQHYFDVQQRFEEKEGTKLNVDLRFTNVSEGRTVSVAFRRETMPYSDIEQDKLRVDYHDSHFSAVAGHFWNKMSRLTLAGAELAGVKIDKQDGAWSTTLLAGRTKDPSLDGTYKQTAAGAAAAYQWGEKNRTTAIALTAWEYDDEYYSKLDGFGPPAADTVLSVMHEYSFRDGVLARLEMAGNVRKEKGEGRNLHDSASLLEVSASMGRVTAEAEAYTAGENFRPVTNMTGRYLMSDREGWRVRGRYRPFKSMSLGGEYETYEKPSTGFETRRGNAFVTFSTGVLRALTLRYDKMSDDEGIVTENSGITAVLGFRRAGAFSGTTLTAAANEYEYTGPGVDTETGTRLLNLSTNFGRRLALSAGWNQTKTDSDTFQLAGITGEAKGYFFSVDWSTVPGRLSWLWRYEQTENSGTNTDNQEKRLKTVMRYSFSEEYSMTLGLDFVKYTDLMTPGNGWRQNILRTGMGMNF